MKTIALHASILAAATFMAIAACAGAAWAQTMSAAGSTYSIPWWNRYGPYFDVDQTSPYNYGYEYRNYLYPYQY